MTRDTRSVPTVFIAALLFAACAPAVTVAPSVPAPPPLVAAFVATIGADTFQIERSERSGNVIRGRVLARVPAVAVRDFRYDYNADGTVARVEWLTRAADLVSDSVLARTVVTFANDTAYVETGVGDAARTQWIPSPSPDLAFIGGLAYSMFEYAAQRTPPTVSDSAILKIYLPALLGGPQDFHLKRSAPDTVVMSARPMGVFRAAFDSAGHAIAFDGRGSGISYLVHRELDIDIDSIAVAFAARGPAGALGTLSPRDTVRSTVHGAQFMVDYGRPTVRGRQIFGAVVPWERVWRLGANQATHFRTERDVVLGGLTVPAGLYTLWVVPVEGDRWQLIVNRETGQWGTMYDATRDLGRIPLTVTRLTEPVEQLTIRLDQRAVGGEFVIEWDTYRASVPFSPR